MFSSTNIASSENFLNDMIGGAAPPIDMIKFLVIYIFILYSPLYSPKVKESIEHLFNNTASRVIWTFALFWALCGCIQSALILTVIAHALVCCTIFSVNFFSRIILIICTLCIVVSFAMVGHSSTNGYLAQFLLLIHLLCISYWLGSFIPLRQLCRCSNYKVISDVAHKFGVYAVVYIGLLVLSGIFYSYILLGDIRNIFSTTYGIILLIKFITVNLLLLIGALNKFKYVPMIKTNPEMGVSKLYSSINFEIILTVIVLSLTSLLTTSFMLPMYN